MSNEPAPHKPEPADAEISALVKRLNSRNETEVRAAVAQLIERGDAGIEALLNTLTAQSRRRRRYLCVSAYTLLGSTILYIISFILKDVRGLYLQFFAYSQLALFLLYVLFTKRQGLLQIASLDDVRIVGVLADAISLNHREVRAEARTALIRLLPRIKQSDAKFLPPEQRKRLLLQFTYRQANPELLFAILAAMEQVGSAEAVPVVSALAAGKGRAAKDSALKQAAIECLPYLEARAQGKELSDTLLRSSSAAEVAPETFLRPALSPNAEPPNELLRPSE